LQVQVRTNLLRFDHERAEQFRVQVLQFDALGLLAADLLDLHFQQIGEGLEIVTNNTRLLDEGDEISTLILQFIELTSENAVGDFELIIFGLQLLELFRQEALNVR